MKKLLFSIALGAICLFSKPLFAVQTPNGVEYYKDTFGTYYYPYSSFSISSLWGTITGHSGEKIYNSSGGTSTTAGWFDVRQLSGDKIVQVLVPTWQNNGTMTLYVEGRLGTSTTGTGTTLLSLTINSTGNLVRILEEDADWIRVGQTVTAIGTETISVTYKQ